MAAASPLTDELKALIENYETLTHTSKETDYDFLKKGQTCIEIRNPLGGENLYLELENGWTLDFNDWNAHYEPTDEGYNDLLKDLRAFLDGKMYVVTVWSGEEWICSFSVNQPRINEEVARKEAREFLHTAGLDEFVKYIRKNGAKLLCSSWTSKGNREIRIRGSKAVQASRAAKNKNKGSKGGNRPTGGKPTGKKR